MPMSGIYGEVPIFYHSRTLFLGLLREGVWLLRGWPFRLRLEVCHPQPNLLLSTEPFWCIVIPMQGNREDRLFYRRQCLESVFSARQHTTRSWQVIVLVTGSPPPPVCRYSSANTASYTNTWRWLSTRIHSRKPRVITSAFV